MFNFFNTIKNKLFYTIKHLSFIPDKTYLNIRYYWLFGKKINWKNPKTFNEKLNWLKIYDRRPEYTIYVDKYKVREYVAETIGKEYLIPLLGVWNTPDEIDFDKLPVQFVLKCNHDSGGLCICKNKSEFNTYDALVKLKKCLKTNFYLVGREYPYRNIPRKIIAEKYMVDDSEQSSLSDYKFMCFDGKVKCSLVCTDRFSDKDFRITWFDRDWNVLPFERPKHPSIKEGLPKPKCYNEMVMLAEKLSKSIPFVRVDFYEINGKVYFGELTLYPGAGFEEFTPRSADLWLGSFIKLPNK